MTFETRCVLGTAAVVIGVPAAWALLSYGTLRPCEMVKQEARAFIIKEMATEMAHRPRVQPGCPPWHIRWHKVVS